MNIKTIAAGLLLIFAALIISVNAIELKTSDDSIYIQSTEGKVFVYVKNTATEDKMLFLSVDGHSLSTAIEPYQKLIRAKSTGGSEIRVYAPDCFRGSDAIQIYAQLCSDSNCETATKKVIVYVEPAKFCANYIEGYAPKVQFVSGTSCHGSDCYNIYSIEPRQSRLVTTNDFDGTSYDLRITGGDSCVIVNRGEMGRVKLTLSNRGAAGNFDLRAVSGSDAQGFVSKDYVSLSRQDSQEVFIDIKPELDTPSGRVYVTMQALHLDELISEKDVCVDLLDEFGTSVIAPELVEARTSRAINLQVEVRNDGTTLQHYSLGAFNDEIQNEITVIPSKFALAAGAAKMVTVEVDATKVSPGTYQIEYSINSEDNDEIAQTTLKVKEDVPIPSDSQISIETEREEKDNAVTVFATIRNDDDTSLTGLSVEVLGIPSSWKVVAPDGFSIPANGKKDITVEITMNSGDEATPTLVLIKNGNEIASQKLPKVSGKAGGFTSLFALNSQNIIIGLVILVAAYLLFTVGRRDPEMSHDMSSIKHEVEHASGGGHDGGIEGHGASGSHGH